jgi:hypothetical protein
MLFYPSPNNLCVHGLVGALSGLGSGSLGRLGRSAVGRVAQLSLDGLGDVLGKVLEVVLVETGHRDSSVTGPVFRNETFNTVAMKPATQLTARSHVDRSLSGEGVDGLGLETGETEHSDLVGDVLPTSGGVHVLEH